MPTKLPLGRLQQIRLREAWENEAGDFTPWLATTENIKLLGDAVDMELEVEATEQQVGPFRADIVCRNLADDSLVLIENQIERTDHNHLGQLLTYAAGLEAVTVVWIAERFQDEHRAALDWLNTITEKKFNFSGWRSSCGRLVVHRQLQSSMSCASPTSGFAVREQAEPVT